MKVEHYDTYVGIDPDREKSGVAIYYRSDKSIILKNLTFFELMDLVKQAKDSGDRFFVIIEGGWLNKGNWHTHAGDSPSLAAKKGNGLGANQETGKKIVEMMEYLNVPHEIVRPSTKKWDDKTFRMITKYTHRSNQDARDAAKLVYGK